MYAGIDPVTSRRCYRTTTVRGNRAEAERALSDVVASVRAEQIVGARSSVSVLLEAWFSSGSISWAPTTVRQTRSVVDCILGLDRYRWETSRRRGSKRCMSSCAHLAE